MKLSERETVDNKQEQAREDKRCTKEAQEADKDAGRQGKWKRNKEVEERNGAGLLRSSVVSQTATIVTLEKVQHIKNFREIPPKPNLYGTYRELL
jgi:hypothetical protein